MNFIHPASDDWHEFEPGSGAAPRQALVTLAAWSELHEQQREALLRDSRVGLLLPNDADVEALQHELGKFALLVLQFPRWTDGRAYTQARLLRLRLRFEGQIRAVGQVLVDMVLPLARSGFDSAVLREDQDVEAARRALQFFPGHYQIDARRPLARPVGLVPSYFAAYA